MSVLACDRDGCPNIMCDRVILEYTAYICDQCHRELVAYKATWPADVKVSDVREMIEAFMRTEPGSISSEDVDAEFERLTEGGR